MKNVVEHMDRILDQHIPGFHQYVLTTPAHLRFVSQNFCRMTGYSPRELLDSTQDRYLSLVHPADRALYQAFLRKLQPEQSDTLEYRLVHRDGSIIFVNDTISTQVENGVLIGSSVLTDITRIQEEAAQMQVIQDSMPCGFLKFTCTKQPKITYIHELMRQILRIPDKQDAELDYWELYRENIYLMIPMKERQRFAQYLQRIDTQGTPLAGELSIQRCDGTIAYVFGWVTKGVNAQGEEEFQSVCLDMTEKYQHKKEQQAQRYISALRDVYDMIFEYDLANGTVQCLCGQKSALFRWLENIPMQMEEATEKWIAATVTPEDQPGIRQFFRSFYAKNFHDSGKRPPEIRYRALTTRGDLQTYSGLFLQVDANVSLFCCRHCPEAELAIPSAGEETVQQMRELVLRFSEGIAAFEVRGEEVTPLYASENLCEFFGYSQEDWLPLMQQSTTLKDFVSRSGVAYQDFVSLLQNGEAEFSYYDLTQKSERRIKAICSQRAPDGNGPRYIMLYNMDEARKFRQTAATDAEVFIRTFGYFDVFVDGTPIPFRSQKSKELLALLIDRRGGYVSSEEAISFLWEDEPVNTVTLSRYRKVALRLKNILEEYGIADIVESVDGKRRIVADRIQCDLYEYLAGKEQLFQGSYLTNYSWGETTLGELTSRQNYSRGNDNE